MNDLSILDLFNLFFPFICGQKERILSIEDHRKNWSLFCSLCPKGAHSQEDFMIFSDISIIIYNSLKNISFESLSIILSTLKTANIAYFHVEDNRKRMRVVQGIEDTLYIYKCIVKPKSRMLRCYMSNN